MPELIEVRSKLLNHGRDNALLEGLFAGDSGSSGLAKAVLNVVDPVESCVRAI